MRRFLFLMVCILLTFASCKKKNDVIPTNTITATVDGVTMNFNNASVGYFPNTDAGGLGAFSIQGYTGANNSGDMIGISIASNDVNNSITEHTYSIYASQNAIPVDVQLVYGINAHLVYDIIDPTANAQTFWSDPNSVQPTVITITSISNTNIQGTFSGVLVYSPGGSSTKTITNGKFNVTIQRP